MSSGKVRNSGTRSTPATNKTSVDKTDSADGGDKQTDAASSKQSQQSEQLNESLDAARRSKQGLDEATTGRKDGDRRPAATEAETAAAHDLKTRRQQSDAWRNSAPVRQLAQNIQNAGSIEDLRDGWDDPTRDFSFEQLRQLQSKPEKLREFVTAQLKKRDDIQSNFTLNPATGFYDAKSEKIAGAADEIVGEIQNDLMREIKGRIADNALGNVRTAVDVNQMINRNSKSRRRFLANLASRLDTPDQVERALVEQGFPRDKASSISDTLGELQGNPSQLDALLDPEQSPARFDRAAKMMKEHFDSQISNLQNLEDRIESDEANPWNQGRKLMTDPNYKFARRAVFEELDVDPDIADGSLIEKTSGEPDYRNGLTELVDQRMESANDAEKFEKNANRLIMVAAGLISGGVGSGIVAGMSTAAASNTPAIAKDYEDVSAAEAAESVGLTDQSQVHSARAERDKAILEAVMDLALAGAGSEASGLAQRLRDTFVQEAIKEGPLKGVEHLDQKLREGLAE